MPKIVNKTKNYLHISEKLSTFARFFTNTYPQGHALISEPETDLKRKKICIGHWN